jgi:hypothetical protein
MHKLKEAKLIMLPMTTHTGCCNLHLDNKRYWEFGMVTLPYSHCCTMSVIIRILTMRKGCI